MADFERDVIHLIRLAVAGRREDVAALAPRLLRRISSARPDLASVASGLVPALTRGVATRALDAVPVDIDSRQHLLRRDDAPVLAAEPIWHPSVRVPLERIVEEHVRSRELQAAGLAPCRSALLVGPPGVGKSMSAAWLARELGRPLLTLDLATVISSYLGRTGSNLRAVLSYAERADSVLLLDEFDAIAKRRDDSAEIGELKRLVTVLLQAVDEWPEGQLLIAATNHPDLLDDAIWRRFDVVIQFPRPSVGEVASLLRNRLCELSRGDDQSIELLAEFMSGLSHAEIDREVRSFRRDVALGAVESNQDLTPMFVRMVTHADRETRIKLARLLVASGRSLRATAEITGLHRNTISKHLTSDKE